MSIPEWTGNEPLLARRYETDEIDEGGRGETADVCENCFTNVPESWHNMDGGAVPYDVVPWDKYKCHLCDYSPIVFAEDWYEEVN